MLMLFIEVYNIYVNAVNCFDKINNRSTKGWHKFCANIHYIQCRECMYSIVEYRN